MHAAYNGISFCVLFDSGLYGFRAFGLWVFDYDVVCSALHGVSNESFKQLKLVVLCEIISETWLARVRRLLA